MTKKDHKFKCVKREAKAYQRLEREVLRAANDLELTEEEVCFMVLIGASTSYIDHYKLEVALHANRFRE